MNYIAYIRNSSKSSAEKGTFIELQNKIIKEYLAKHDPEAVILNTYIEVETGTGKRRRVEVYKAIREAQSTKATLISARLYRLSRDVAFLHELLKTGVPFIACDFTALSDPALNTLILTIFVALGAYEAAEIRKRILPGIKHHIEKMKALDPLYRWGNRKNILEVGKRNLKLAHLAKRNKAVNNENNRKALDCIKGKVNEGLMYKEIALYLNKENYKTSTEREWSAQTVQQLFFRKALYL